MPYLQTINAVHIALTEVFDELDTWFDKPVITQIERTYAMWQSLSQ